MIHRLLVERGLTVLKNMRLSIRWELKNALPSVEVGVGILQEYDCSALPIDRIAVSDQSASSAEFLGYGLRLQHLW